MARDGQAGEDLVASFGTVVCFAGITAAMGSSNLVIHLSCFSTDPRSQLEKPWRTLAGWTREGPGSLALPRHCNESRCQPPTPREVEELATQTWSQFQLTGANAPVNGWSGAAFAIGKVKVGP